MVSRLRRATLPICSDGFVGKVVGSLKERKLWEMDKLLRRGFRVHAWDGRTPHALLDADRQIIAILAGQPNDAMWGEAVSNVSTTLASVEKTCTFSRLQRSHRRGRFPTLATGISHGGGQRKPQDIYNTAANQMKLTELCCNCGIQQIASFENGAFAAFAPKAFGRAAVCLQELYNHKPSLRQNFPNSIYPTATFNFGPNAVCFDHTNEKNSPAT
ncbi:hypothetical protein SCP_0300480 [Sparassis crispa]|uniref:Uncharacterized protein n=1 Tax=Sparassis crispa TaxID=139825 RepID=A0A401GDZ3_9APHY|nr:hypothetical protein SCP_0300480 [Sparassis crispa]GBE80333.1 hypothetical protein SCP_0300480 [Sparassis crispa]